MILFISVLMFLWPSRAPVLIQTEAMTGCDRINGRHEDVRDDCDAYTYSHAYTEDRHSIINIQSLKKMQQRIIIILPKGHVLPNVDPMWHIGLAKAVTKACGWALVQTGFKPQHGCMGPHRNNKMIKTSCLHLVSFPSGILHDANAWLNCVLWGIFHDENIC